MAGQATEEGPRRGLTAEDAARLLAEHGPNEIARAEGTPWWRLFIGQFAGVLVWLLTAATILSAILGEVVDAVSIAAILIINAFVGFLQEHKSERAVLALRSMTAPHARVIRDGRTAVVPAAQVVVGDVLVLEAGDVVAADALSTSEASLTGESTPVEKSAAPVAPDAPLADRADHVFLGTAVANGTGFAEVVATGMGTELGKIADLIATTESEETPLQKRLTVVGRSLLWLCLGVVGIVAVLSLVRGLGWLQVLMSSVSLAVAAVPEGLAAVVTIALAVGVQRMAGRNVLVRKLAAVETLGSTTVICTDKTGTLTTGVMVVRETAGGEAKDILFAGAADCDAELAADGKSGTGDTTEVAILMAAAEQGIRREEIERARARTAVQPFDSNRRRMSIRRADGVLYVKGAAESLVPLCSSGAERSLELAAEMASRGLRVLAVAVGDSDEEANLRMLGLIGIADPPRAEAIAAVAQARAAGIRTVMITGDHPATATAIAREMGILGPGEDEKEIVHARATPQEKLQLVRDWKQRGAIVAMTGDGVNDAPALKEAHIGIAMGKTGTEVAREASAMVLTDDNFASIVAAIREGRGIYDNIQKTLTYLLAGNFGELLLMLLAAVVGLPLPLLPLQLLWINLVTDGLPALALVMDPVDPDVLGRAPRRPNAKMLGRAQWMNIVVTGSLQAALTLGVYAWGLAHRNLAEARNLAFSVVVFVEVLRAFAARSETKVHWEMGAFSNWRLLAVVGASVLLQVAIHHLPFTQRLFDIGPISLTDCAMTLALGLIPVSALEIWKLVRRRFAPPRTEVAPPTSTPATA